MHALTSEEVQTITKVAKRIKGFGLQLPMLFMLEAGQPLSFIGGQLLWVLQPTASLFVPSTQLGHWATLLENPVALSELRHQLSEKQEFS